ncbi:C40 family peptidase [Kineosporia succinea]|uniref:Cell wall-associated NlpC family hydrolase n=1 Tax=Kineosporia succinea TaxID=84632 RepID=A0ABT9P7H1_9ACTN|nr:C40 family peptidase [Kineosporia succinea]MDP9828655.1 cell wall-associated NlpC family hydrolase [Kineosporia succinea]
MPLSAVFTGAALTLTGGIPALAADGSTGSDEAKTGAAALKTATVKVSDTETARITRKATAKATARLTKKVKATAKVTAWSTRTAKATRTVTVTTSATDYNTAVAKAKAAAKKKAHERARSAAIAEAKKQAVKNSRAKAKHRAQDKAERLVRVKFGAEVVSDAAKLKGTPYVYGATGPRAFDCSGYVGYVLRQNGVTHLNRTSSGLVKNTKKVSKHAKKKGDLVFFSSGSGVYHVGIYAGGGKIWHAPKPGSSVKKETIWTSSYSVGRVKV